MSKYKLVLPVDTVVEDGSNERRYIKKSRIKDGRIKLFCDGLASVTHTGSFNHLIVNKLHISKNKPQPWFGGECPVSEGVYIKFWLRDGGFSGANVLPLRWSHGGAYSDEFMRDIIAYQILEQVLTFERDESGVIIGFSSELVEDV